MKHPKILTAAAIYCLTLSAWSTFGLATASADWSLYRGDPSRSGYTTEPVSLPLTQAWEICATHSPDRAWIGRSLSPSRMKFDWIRSAVVADGIVCFGDSSDDTLRAVDARTGKLRWRFITGGPIRLAPAIDDSKVYAGSDDGYLYCLDLDSGKPVWKHRLGPTDELQVGNGRMVSRWVVRGGPVIRDGVVYCAAGIWPSEGTYIQALDAETGRVIWSNDSSGYLEIDQPHMRCFARGGVCAQGYLAASDKYLFVATGRSVPAVFDRATGRFIHFHLSRYGGKTPWGTGGGDIVCTDDVFVNAGIIFDTPTGLRYRNIGQRLWWDAFTRDGRRCHGEYNDGERQHVSFTPDGIVRTEGSTLYLSELTQRDYTIKRELETAVATPRLPTVTPGERGARDFNQEKSITERINDAPHIRDRTEIKLPGEPLAMIVVGRHAFLGFNQCIRIVDLRQQKIIQTLAVDAPARSLAFDDGRLFVSTESGAILCFASADTAGNKIATIEPPVNKSPEAIWPDYSLAKMRASAILMRSNITQGYCLDLSGDGALACAIADKTQLHVITLVDDLTQLEAVRNKLVSAGIYGTRVTALNARLESLPDYFANLIVSSDSKSLHRYESDDNFRKQIDRLLRPAGGVLILGDAQGTDPGKGIYTKRKPLPGGGNWTHNLGTAGNAMYSGEQLVAAPLGMLWYRDETQVTIDRHGKNPAPLAYNGYLLRLGIDDLTCTDAYNGTLLWQVELPGVLAAYREGTQVGGGGIGGTYCVGDDIIFVRANDRCLMLDIHTGKKIGELNAPRFPDDRKGRWGHVAYDGGILIGSLMNEDYVIKSQHGKGDERMQSEMSEHFTESSLLFAFDTKERKLLWTHQPQESIRNNTIAAGDGRVFFIDRPIAEMDKILRSIVQSRRRGDPSIPIHPTGKLIALNARTGKDLWSDDDNIFGTVVGANTKHDVLLFGYSKMGFARPSDGGRGMRAYRASTGKRLWQTQHAGTRPAMSDDGLISSYPMAFDMETGKLRTADRATATWKKGETWRIRGKGQGCGLVAASDNLLMLRSGTLAYYDLQHDGGWLDTYGGMRAGCFINAIPTGGIIVVPDDTRACRCSYQNQATIALHQRGTRPIDIKPAVGQRNYRYLNIAREVEFTGTLRIAITHPDPSLTIRYTTDGTPPTADSPIYTSPITIDEDTAISAAGFKGEKKTAERIGARFYTKE